MFGPIGFRNQKNVKYEYVEASQSEQALGATGKAGDFLSHLVVIPLTTAAGTIALKDGELTAVNVFISGTLADLKPHVIPIGASAVNGAWKVTTGGNVRVLAVGQFS